MEVNREWICDDGRYIYHAFEDLDRLTAPRAVKEAPATQEAALQAIAGHIGKLQQEGRLDEAAVCGSAWATVEDNYMLRRLFADGLGIRTVLLNAPAPEGEDIICKSGFTIRSDKSPNRRGAGLALGSGRDLWQGLREGKIRTLFLLGGAAGLELTDEQKKLLDGLEMLVVWDVAAGDLVRAADLALPMTSFTEEEGTFVNVQGRLQRIHAALQPPAGIKPAWSSLAGLVALLQQPVTAVTAADLFNDLAGRLPALAGISYFKLAKAGVLLS